MAIIEVDRNIRPKHHTKRSEPKLEIGKDYFVSFGMNQAIPCVLIEILKATKEVRINISEKGHSGIHQLFADEIGLTPEEAVSNEHTF